MVFSQKKAVLPLDVFFLLSYTYCTQTAAEVSMRTDKLLKDNANFLQSGFDYDVIWILNFSPMLLFFRFWYLWKKYLQKEIHKMAYNKRQTGRDLLLNQLFCSDQFICLLWYSRANSNAVLFQLSADSSLWTVEQPCPNESAFTHRLCGLPSQIRAKYDRNVPLFAQP